jgi:hypothetical protein
MLGILVRVLVLVLLVAIVWIDIVHERRSHDRDGIGSEIIARRDGPEEG